MAGVRTKALLFFLAMYIQPVISSPLPCTEQCADPAKVEEVDDTMSFIQLKPKDVEKRMAVATINGSTVSNGKNSSLLATSKDSCDSVHLVPLAEMSYVVYDLHPDTTITSPTPSIDAAHFVLAETLRQPDFVPGGDFVPALAIWTRETPCKQAVIAIKGTDLGSLTDIVADVQSIVGGVNPDKAKEELGEYVSKYQGQGYTVLVTGHSLGGYMGEITSTTFNVAGAVFDAPGPDGPITRHNGDYTNPNFHNLNAYEDPIGNLAAGLFAHNQWTIYVERVRTHSMGAMLDELKIAKFADVTTTNVMSYCTSAWYGYDLAFVEGLNGTRAQRGYYVLG